MMATLAFEVFSRWPGFDGELVPTFNRHRHMELLLSRAGNAAIRVRPAPDGSGSLSMLHVKAGRVEIHLEQELHDVLDRIGYLVRSVEYSAEIGGEVRVPLGVNRASDPLL
jgi:hypothetical protein